jgi:hypothetical protein
VAGVIALMELLLLSKSEFTKLMVRGKFSSAPHPIILKVGGGGATRKFHSHSIQIPVRYFA